MKRIILSTLISFACTGAASAAVYDIDRSHTQVFFTYSHLGFSHLSGRLNEVTGSFDYDATKPAKSSIDVQLPLSSLSTGVPKLDEHLATADFFDAGKFPTATFKSSKVTVLGKDRLSVAGDLTIHGVTRPATFAVTLNGSGIHPMKKTAAVGFDATTTIKRSDFGIAKYVPMVADEVRLNISMEAQQPVKADAVSKKAG